MAKSRSMPIIIHRFSKKLTFRSDALFATQQVDEVEKLTDNLACLLVRDANVRLSVVVVEDGRVEEHAHHVTMLLL